MDFATKLKRFMKYIRDKYETDDAFRAYGGYPWPLIAESNIDFGDGAAQLAAMDILLRHGLIEVVDRENPKHVELYDSIRPSHHFSGATRIEQRKIWQDIVSAVAEGVTRGIIKG
jgi:hypothetical protein